MTSRDVMTMDRQQLLAHRGSDKYLRLGGLGIFMTMWLAATAQAADLQNLDFNSLPGDKAQVTLTFSEPVEAPNNFATDEPARIVLDFDGVKNALSERTRQINSGETRSIATVEAGDRTRMVINLLRKIPYEIQTDGNIVKVTLNGNAPQMSNSQARGSAVPMSGNQVTNVDFRRGEDGEARVIIDLASAGAAVDVRQERDTVVVELPGVALPEKLHRRLDVVDFATPVSLIDAEQSRDGTTLTLTTNRDFEHLAYQSDNQLVVEVKARETVSQSDRAGDQVGYTGEKLSLNFQNIEVRAVLQLLADFNGMNLVTSDTVTGNLTLRLKNVPWDQALEIILKTKGLAMRQNGNVMLIAPAAEIAAREKQELEAKKQLVELEPLYSEIIEVNFAKADEIATILTTTQGDSADGKGGFLSERGSVVVDARTNSLLLRDTADQLVQIQKLIEQLDIPVRQVLIESRIVIANNDFSKELGVRFGASGRSRTLGAGTSGSLDGLEVREGNSNPNLSSPVGMGNDPRGLGEDLNVNLPVTNPAGSIALALAKLPMGMILELELSAMQEEGRGEVISSPRVITSNQKQATIEQGTEIPYQEASSSGATSVSFKEAVLKLDVTPQITPDDRIVMDLEVNKDEVGEIFLGVPSIDTRSVKTQVLVDNGETVVLGGIYEQTKNTGVQRVPFFGDLPYVGVLFRNTFNEDRQRELLVFVTPKIVKEGMQY
ncbi:type IV pilus secretin PilQ [Methylophaga sp. OBS3]|uniref:type IV pilus secretin PilQ n=1 Tax=Methylophaga sp. OBS3 TaxID=2991934 RepID=UPI00225669CF|nr:type IV pilus secretin PilQ [Methylophaga sp. OBS3]MCX4189921.1 type IV pilus secretin PilQ [Methylophaga sp. OBS3]